MVVQLGWFYQTSEGGIARAVREAFEDALDVQIVSGLDPLGGWCYRVHADGRRRHGKMFLILESGSWLHDLTAAWKPGDGILAERLKEAGRRVV